MTYPTVIASPISQVFDTRVIGSAMRRGIGSAMRRDGDETSEVQWSTPTEIEHGLDINHFTRALLREVGGCRSL